MQTLSRKFTVALVTILIFSLLFSLVGYTESAQQYFSFTTLMLTIVTLSAPMFLIVGVVTSYVVEKFSWNESIKFFSYIIIGAILIIPYSLYIFNGGSLRFSLLGAIGAALFYGVQKIFQRYIFKA